MSDIDAVIELLERWREATGMGRMRIGIDATRTIAALPAARKRALAIEVAQRVAPQLVPAIQAEDGDLSTQQVGAVVDLLRRADQEQLDDLVAALRSGDVTGTLDLVDDAVAVVAPPDAETDALLEDIATADDHDEDAAGTAGVTAATAAAASAAASALGDDDEVEVAADGSLRLDEDAVRERMEAEAAERYRDTSRDVPATPAYRAPDLDFTTEDLELPDPTVESVAPLHERMAQREAGGGRRLAAAPVTQVVAAVTATPDGYRRRRAALQAIREGRLDGQDVVPIVRSLERGTDRSWVAGAALDAGLIDGSDLDGLELSAAAVGRLRRRAR